MFSNLQRSLTALFMLLLLSGCASDPFDDITLQTHLISAKNIDKIKTEIRPGFHVRGELKDKTAFRLQVLFTDKTAVHGTRGEKIRFDKLEFVEYISPADYSLGSRASQLGMAALAVLAGIIMGLAGLIDAIIRIFSGT